MITPQRALLDKDDRVVDVVGLSDKWNLTPEKGLRVGPKAPGPLVVGGIFDGEEYRAPEVALKALVNDERVRRLNDGLVYDGHKFQTDPESIEEIKEWQVMAMTAIAAGRDDLMWTNREEEFYWLDSDNKPVEMTALEFSQFSSAVIAYKADVRIAARNLKDMQPIPGDYADDKYWPDSTLE